LAFIAQDHVKWVAVQVLATARTHKARALMMAYQHSVMAGQHGDVTKFSY
jgi:hypothetical protein